MALSSMGSPSSKFRAKSFLFGPREVEAFRVFSQRAKVLGEKAFTFFFFFSWRITTQSEKYQIFSRKQGK
jgi:hypothetical protein